MSDETDAVGTICVLTSDHGRYTSFWGCLHQLSTPGPVKLIIKIPGVAVAKGRNEALTEADGDWIWFIDDDHEFPKEILMNLLARDVDIVAPLCLFRRKPFGPTMMGEYVEYEGQRAHKAFALNPGDRGLKPVQAIGTAGMLIRRRVWEKLPPKPFRVGQPEEGDVDGIAEDIAFCRLAREAGFGIFCDLDNPLGHYLDGYVIPQRDEDGVWKTRLVVGGAVISLPQPKSRFDLGVERIILPNKS